MLFKYILFKSSDDKLTNAVNDGNIEYIILIYVVLITLTIYYTLTHITFYY